MYAILLDQPMSRSDVRAEAAEQAILKFPQCQIRVADRPPFFRCSCGARYDNHGQHPETPGPSDPQPDQPAQQYPFDN